MKVCRATALVAILLLGYISSAQVLAAPLGLPSNTIRASGGESERVLGLERELITGRQYKLLKELDSGKQKISSKHSFNGLEPSAYGDVSPQHFPEIRPCEDPQFDCIAASPYYKASFKGARVRIDLAAGWVEFELTGNKSLRAEITGKSAGEPHILEELTINESSITLDKNLMKISDVFEAADLSYTAETSLLREILTLRQYRNLERIVGVISWDGLTPEFQEDGSIIFSAENPALKILPPFHGRCCRQHMH